MTDIKMLERMASSVRAAQMHLESVDADGLSSEVSDDDCWKLDDLQKDADKALEKLHDHIVSMNIAREG